MNTKIKHLPLLLTTKKSGLHKTPRDGRDYDVGIFGWGKYEPKHTIKLIPTLSVKNQEPFNTCQWNATTVQKEVDEKVILQQRSIVAKGKQMGLVSGNGFSNMRSGQAVLKEWGIVEDTLLADGSKNWNNYVNIELVALSQNANLHKIVSYWTATNKSDMLKLLDDGRILTTGIDWYTGYNMKGGFKNPWIIDKPIGWKVGGHAFISKGYVIGYKGIKDGKIITGSGGINVFANQNSYGEDWGATITHEGVVHKGLFFTGIDYLSSDNYGTYANLDFENGHAKFLNTFDGENVKGTGKTVYFIQKGLRKPYPDEITYLAFNVRDSKISNWHPVKDETLEQVRQGDSMDIKKSPYWDYLKNIEGNEARMNKLVSLLIKK